MEQLIKNLDRAQPLPLKEQVAYEKGKVVSLTLTQRPGVGMTLFAFDAGEGISTHAAPGDAMVYVLDGEAQITIGGAAHTVPGSRMRCRRVPHSKCCSRLSKRTEQSGSTRRRLCPEIPGAQLVSFETPGADRKGEGAGLRPAVYSARAFQQGAAAFSRIR